MFLFVLARILDKEKNPCPVRESNLALSELLFADQRHSAKFKNVKSLSEAHDKTQKKKLALYFMTSS